MTDMPLTIPGFTIVEKPARGYNRKAVDPQLTVTLSKTGAYSARFSKTALPLLNGAKVFSILNNPEQTTLLFVADSGGKFKIGESGSISGNSVVAALGKAPSAGTKLVLSVTPWQHGKYRGVQAS